MNVPIITVIAAIVLVVLASGCDRQEAAWQEAKEADTIAAYQAYVEAHGDGTQADEAEQRIRALQAADLWKEIREAETVEAYERFLKRFPDSQEAEEARARIAELERQNEWAGLRTSSDIDALRAFAERYHDYPLGEEARQRVGELEEAEAREQARLEEERQRRLAEEATRTHRVQVAALRSEEQARDGAGRLEERLAATLGEIGLEIEESGRFYLIRTEPLTEPDARSLCERLQDQNQECFVVTR
jgi:phosphoserine phosphatase